MARGKGAMIAQVDQNMIVRDRIKRDKHPPKRTARA